ncbi:MAG: Na/Pi cotransporter family protein [Faecalibacterium sp.]|nr:Na/Pi cotransporter family protein [Faecalibacterium sp.]
MSIFNVFSLLGGLALFLFGMDIMGKALEKQAGGDLERILSKMTDTPLKGFGLGLLVTAIIQSSSATTVMVVGFVNSGIMKLHQAIGIIMGANVGTTVTAWLLSMSAIDGSSMLVQLLKPSNFSPLLAFIGIILYMFTKSERKKGVGTILIGFAVLMSGMETMSAAVEPLKDAQWFTSIFIKFQNPILGVLAGAILTGIIQSSSASVGILQALSATGAITFGSAIPIIMGQNIGTCITAMISSIGTNKNARRASFVHLYFNIIGVIIFLTGFYTLNAFLHFDFITEAVSSVNIAIVHTTFNLTTTLILLPFNTVLEKLAYLTLPEDPQQEEEQFSLLDVRLMEVPAVAVDRAFITAGDMAEIVRMNLLQAMSLTHGWDEALAQKVARAETMIDQHEDMLGTYLVQLSQHELTREDNHVVNTLLHAISDFERIGDYADNIAETARTIREKGVAFSDAALDELGVLEGAVQDIVGRTIDCFEKKDLYLAGKVEPLEEVIDGLVREIKLRHIARLQSGQCTIEYGFVLDDLLTSYERIADHCSNIAVAMIEVERNSFDTHAYLNELKDGNEKFSQRYEKYRARYLFAETKEEGTNE